jgi:hypothetical protein
MAAVGRVADRHNIRVESSPLVVGAALAANLLFRIVHQSGLAKAVMPGALFEVPELP